MANIFAREIARTLEDIQQVKANIARDEALLAADPTNERLKIQIASGQAYLIDLDAQLAFFQETNSAPVDSAGQIVAQDAQARTDGAATSNPPSPTDTVQVFPANQINQNLEVGTDGRLRSTIETQATPPNNNGSAVLFSPNDDDGNPLPGTATQNAGVGANRDDNVPPNNNTTAQIINASFNQRIVPQANVLDEYASYTYAISWYLLTPTQYNEMIRSQKKNCASWQLLIQSGGAPTQIAGASGGRNQYFGLDYYIDNLEIESRIPLKGTGAADGRVSIKFTVTEPNGITLVDKLYRAVSNLYKQANVTNVANYPRAHYCLAIRFYGYNESGELVTTGRRGTNGTNNLTDPKAIVEKFYPFVLVDLKFKIPKDRVVEYQIEGKPIPHFYNKSQDRGTIPFAFELTGETIEQVLRGKPAGANTSSDVGERRDSPQPNTSAPAQPPDDAGNFEIDSLGFGA